MIKMKWKLKINFFLNNFFLNKNTIKIYINFNHN